MVRRLFDAYHSFRPFTEEEAWLLFKLAAIGEACGWTLLISGILCHQYLLPSSNIPVLLAGRIHGVLFFLYILSALVLAPSLRWSPCQTLIAGCASVPPYGSLVFELWTGQRRRAARYQRLNGLITYQSLVAAD